MSDEMTPKVRREPFGRLPEVDMQCAAFTNGTIGTACALDRDHDGAHVTRSGHPWRNAPLHPTIPTIGEAMHRAPKGDES